MVGSLIINCIEGVICGRGGTIFKDEGQVVAFVIARGVN